MKLVHIICLLLHVYAPLCMAAPSLLAICHKDWNCEATIKLYEQQDIIKLSWLERTFGDKCSCVNKLLNDDRPKIARVHIINGPCMRNKRCGRYEPFYGHTIASANRDILRGGKVLDKYKVLLNRVASRFKDSKNLTCYVSPCLECDLNERVRRLLGNLVLSVLPNCNLVDNPLKSRCLPGVVCERHGYNPRVTTPCIVDLDGSDGSAIDSKKWLAKYSYCDLSFYWEPWMNCIRGNFIDPRSRNCKYDKSIFEGALCRSFLPPLSDTCLP
jgi:hypothetical protein